MLSAVITMRRIALPTHSTRKFAQKKDKVNCLYRLLEHISIIHPFIYRRQKCYVCSAYQIYISFHETNPKAAHSIAQIGFLVSNAATYFLKLRYRIYFPRSFKSTIGKTYRSGMMQIT